MRRLSTRPARLLAAAAALIVAVELVAALALRGGWKAVVFGIAVAGMAALVVAASRYGVGLAVALPVLACYALVSAAIVAAAATISGDQPEAEGRVGVAGAVLVLMAMAVAPAYLVAIILEARRRRRTLAELER